VAAIRQTITLVDGTLLSALPQMMQASLQWQSLAVLFQLDPGV